MIFVRTCLLASVVCFGALPFASGAFAQTASPASPTTNTIAAKPDVADLLFGNPQWGAAPVGSTISYTYTKKTTDAAFGASFEDHVTLKLDKGETPDRRTVEVKMFSGGNARPAGPFDSTAQNPVLLLVLEENVQELSKLFKGNPRYIKDAIRRAWREKAEIASTPVMVDGKPVPGTRITVQPFLNDPEKDKMLGLDTMRYVVEIADSVPGQITTIDITAPATGSPKFSEVLKYQGETKP